MTIKNEFDHSRFDMDAVERLTEAGWTDTSWHNDAYPSFQYGGEEDANGNLKFRIWVCDTLPQHREDVEHLNFALDTRCDDDSGDFMHTLESDDIDELLTFVAAAMKVTPEDIQNIDARTEGLL